MDWFQDDDTDGDFGTVFKYNETTPLPTTVVLLETEDRVDFSFLYRLEKEPE